MGQIVSFSRTDGRPAQGYLAEPTGAATAGVVVIQEWWGLQGQIKSTCDRLAAAGFRALAPDLFDGKVIPYHDRISAKTAMAALDFGAAVDGVVRGAVQHLRGEVTEVGLMGFCMGGAITIIGAVRIPELGAAVCFYGLPSEELAAPDAIRVPLQAHFATQDDWCTPAIVTALEARLKAAGKVFEIHRYEARHAFMNAERPEAHDPQAARVAWERCLAFLRERLG